MRSDYAGAWHHLANRGLAKRTIFERRADVRYFLSRIAQAVRRGEIEIHAYSLLSTHFHMLVRSTEGDLARAMRRIQGEYSRYFNRTRGRDGPLFRGRYMDKIVESDIYRDNVIRYIDANAVEAGLVALPQWHICSSARWYATRCRSPGWLTRDWIEARVSSMCDCAEFAPESYVSYYRPQLCEDIEDWVMRRLAAGESEPDPLDDLIDAAPPKVLEWMRRRAELGDGTPVGIPLLPASVLDSACVARQPSFSMLEESRQRKSGREVPLVSIARAGLLSGVAGLRAREVGLRLELHSTTAASRVQRHRKLMRETEAYSRLSAEIVHSGLQQLR